MSTTLVVRDHAFEAAFLAEVAEGAQRVEHVDAHAFPSAVLARLEQGAGEYGESWADRPLATLLAEASDEPADACAWIMLYLQRLRGELPEHEWLEAKMIALRAAVYAAASDRAMRELARVVDELVRGV